MKKSQNKQTRIADVVINMIADNLINLGHSLKSELLYDTDFEFVVAVILSAQCTDIQVNRVTRKLFPIANTPQQILCIGNERIASIVKSVGLWRMKSANIFALSKQLVLHHNGQVPRSSKVLESLPGIGRKTANVILNELYQEPKIAVDTHVLRLSSRLHLSKAKTPAKVEQDLYKLISTKYHGIVSNALVLHGRYICKAKKPLPELCSLKEYCCLSQDSDERSL